MKILGLDLETTGLSTSDDQIIEIGAVLWDWERNLPVEILSQLVQIDGEVPSEITELTGISNEDLSNHGQSLEVVLKELKRMAKFSSYLVAHNGTQFDQIFLEREWSLQSELRIELPWLDTSHDLPFPAKIGTRKLSYLAAEHGFLNPFSHRAVFDVLTMLKVLAQYRHEDVLKLQSSPLRRVVAQVSYEGREQAKGAGFRWDPVQRHWFLEGKECQLQDRSFPFPVLWL